MGDPTVRHPSSAWPGSGLALLCPTCPFASGCPKPMNWRSHPSAAVSKRGLSLQYTKLCLRVCLERVGNGHAEKRQWQKNPGKINCGQYLIDTVSEAGTVIQAKRRGGRKALALGVARYFHWYCPCFPTSRQCWSRRGCLQKGHKGIFATAALPTLSLRRDHAATPAPLPSSGVLLREARDHAASASLCPDLTRRAGPAAAVTAAASRAGPCTQLAPAPVESPHWLLFSRCFS